MEQYSHQSDSTKYCPACRAALHNDLLSKPCTIDSPEGGFKLRRLRWKFSIPIILVPVGILLICLYYSSTSKKNNQYVSGEKQRHHIQESFYYDPVNDDFHNHKEIYRDVQTSFVPPEPPYRSIQSVRRKRDIFNEDTDDDIHDGRTTIEELSRMSDSDQFTSDVEDGNIGDVDDGRTTIEELSRLSDSDQFTRDVEDGNIGDVNDGRTTIEELSRMSDSDQFTSDIEDGNKSDVDDRVEDADDGDGDLKQDDDDAAFTNEDGYQSNDTSEEIVWTIPEAYSSKQHHASNGIDHMTHLSREKANAVKESLLNIDGDLTMKKYGKTAVIETIQDQSESSFNAVNQAYRKKKTNGIFDVNKGTVDVDTNNKDDPDMEIEESVDEEVVDDHELIGTNDGLLRKERGGADFHAFWRGEGDKDTIQRTQARIMRTYMDTTVDPCVDFYQYACGNWAVHHPIPKDKGGYDTFEMLRESLHTVLKEILEKPVDAVDETSMDNAWVKAKHLYQSCMDYDILEQRGETPLLELLNDLGGWPMLNPNWDGTTFDWLILMAQLRLYNNDILISEWVGPDIKNSDEYIIQFDQTTLGLPSRDYFLVPSNKKYLLAYKNYMIRIAQLLGTSLENATIQSGEVIDFETTLAELTSSPDERRNVSELYNRMTVGELRRWIPQVNWLKYLDMVLARPVRLDEPVVVFALKYIQDMVSLVARTPKRIVSNYLLWRFVRHRIGNLDDRFQEAKQRFYYILFGREQAPLRWKTCVTQVNSNMGMALGAMFVHKYFDEQSKHDTLLMTEAITESFRGLLSNTKWIDQDTKHKAFLKVEAMLLRIGYPDFILDREALNDRYSDVNIAPELYFENTLNILRHLTRVEQDRIGHVVNKTQWNTAPAVVNAYYSRNKNQIIFPAGILQPPFYHRLFPKSLNYGGIGVVIGHEITHGFDDKGRLFDHHGNLLRWWNDKSIDGFHARAQCLIDQYSQYVVQEINMQVDGLNTQGENIADNGGIKQAYIAYHKWLDANDNQDEMLPGLNATGDQLFFLNFAQVWCGSTRPETARNKLKTTVHAPGKFRVIGTLSNSYEFAKAFTCATGAPMNPTEKCSVW